MYRLFDASTLHRFFDDKVAPAFATLPLLVHLTRSSQLRVSVSSSDSSAQSRRLTSLNWCRHFRTSSARRILYTWLLKANVSILAPCLCRYLLITAARKCTVEDEVSLHHTDT